MFVFKSKHDQVVCRSCERHQGDSESKLTLKDRDHVALWRSELGVQNENAALKEAALAAKIASLERELTSSRTESADLRETIRRGFEQAPLPLVEKWLTSEALVEARDHRDAAYRARDRAFTAIWALDRMHGASDADENQCACGKRLHKCREAAALQQVVEQLTHWENNQIDRLRRGLPCGLPQDHPEFQKHGGRQRYLR